MESSVKWLILGICLDVLSLILGKSVVKLLLFSGGWSPSVCKYNSYLTNL